MFRLNNQNLKLSCFQYLNKFRNQTMFFTIDIVTSVDLPSRYHYSIDLTHFKWLQKRVKFFVRWKQCFYCTLQQFCITHVNGNYIPWKFASKENSRIEFSTHDQRFPSIKYHDNRRFESYSAHEKREREMEREWEKKKGNHTHFKFKYQIRAFRIHLSSEMHRRVNLSCLVRNRFLLLLIPLSVFFSIFNRRFYRK